MCCKKCALSGHKNYMNAFISFNIYHDEKVRKEEGEQLFGRKMDGMEWKLDHRKTTEDLFSIFVVTNRESIEDKIISSSSFIEET